LAEVQEF